MKTYPPLTPDGIAEVLNAASHAGWYLVTDEAAPLLMAVNPRDHSEVWVYSEVERRWKRAGFDPVEFLRLL